VTDVPAEVTAFFAGSPLGLAAYRGVSASLADVDGWRVRVTRSQVAFRRRRGFAWLWLPGSYLAHPAAEVVLTIALGRRDPSPRFKEVVPPSPAHWIHHLELQRDADVDDEVAGWLREAAARA
jgi:hypothetical protein